MRVQLLFAILTFLGAQLPIQVQAADAPVMVDGRVFADWDAYFQSDYFKNNPSKRCGTVISEEASAQPPSDCSMSLTNHTPPEYAPGTIWEIPIVVHVIMNAAGTQGNISDALIHSQIDVLNEDFRALAGTPGENGEDFTVQFALATLDPDGNPTTGITRHNNDTWFNDGGAYYNTLAWNTNRYCNIYTNSAGGNLGYAFVPNQGGVAGQNFDRIVIFWRSFGRPSSFPPYHLGRTATHEMGHYLGLLHTFQGGCAVPTPPACYANGDLICDTNPEPSPNFGCPVNNMRCGLLEPVRNYMDYSDDVCYDNFTFEQARRSRCTLLHWRPQVYSELVDALAQSSSPKVETILGLNRPNPFNPATQLTFDLAREGRVSLVVTDVNGRAIKTLAAGTLPRGEHRYVWNGTDDANAATPSGVYFYRLETQEGSQTGRMVLVR